MDNHDDDDNGAWLLMTIVNITSIGVRAIFF